MPSWMDGWPVLVVLLFFLVGAVLRSQAIYWLGRGLAVGVVRSRDAHADRSADDRGAVARLRDRLAASLDSRQMARARVAVERWGMPVVPLAFLTVGFQSAVFATVGLLRIGWLAFTLWSLPGAVAWAVVWGGGGMVAAAGVVAAAREAPGALAAVLLGAGLAVTVVTALVRRRRARTEVAAGRRQ